jgi:hypothetical protein
VKEYFLIMVAYVFTLLVGPSMFRALARLKAELAGWLGVGLRARNVKDARRRP